MRTARYLEFPCRTYRIASFTLSIGNLFAQVRTPRLAAKASASSISLENQ